MAIKTNKKFQLLKSIIQSDFLFLDKKLKDLIGF